MLNIVLDRAVVLYGREWRLSGRIISDHTNESSVLDSSQNATFLLH